MYIIGSFHLIEACCCRQVASVVSNSVQPHRRQPTRLPCPWDSPGKNTGVGCHFLLQQMKVKSESEVAPLCPTLLQPTRLVHPWDFPGKSAGVGYHCLLRIEAYFFFFALFIFFFWKSCFENDRRNLEVFQNSVKFILHSLLHSDLTWLAFNPYVVFWNIRNHNILIEYDRVCSIFELF